MLLGVFKKVCQNQKTIFEMIDCQCLVSLNLSLTLEFELSLSLTLEFELSLSLTLEFELSHSPITLPNKSLTG